MSGADVAWLTDEVGEGEARRSLRPGDQVWHVAAPGRHRREHRARDDRRAVAAVLATGVGMIALGVVLVVVMPETRFVPRARAAGESAVGSMAATFREGVAAVRAHYVLVLDHRRRGAPWRVLDAEGFDRLSDFHLLVDIGLPEIGGLDRIAWFGVLDGVALLAGLVAVTAVKRWLHLEGHGHVAKILAVIDVALVAAVIAFGVTGAFWVAVSAFWVVGGLRERPGA